MKHYCKNDKPYVYVAFQQEQKEEILPVLESVAVDGAQFWYADRFDRREKGRLQRAFGVLLFVTTEFSASERFRSIVDTAVAAGQKILSVYLEDIPATPWSAMQLGSQQALFAENFDDAFISKLKEAFIFQDMAVTKAQKKYQRNRAITMAAVPIMAAVVLFFAVVNPLLIAPVRAAETAAKRWGLTREDLESITELFIVGDQTFDTYVHAWYDDDEHTRVIFDMDVKGWMENQGSIPAGSLTSEDLDIFSYMPNLERLCICGNQITDISPLFCLKNLRELDLSANPISSLEGIDVLSKLEGISLTDTDITDPSPLWNCSEMRGVLLDSTYISDISGAERLSHLGHLNISGTYVRDASALGRASALRSFSAAGTPITNIPAFAQTRNIQLDLRQMPIKDYSFLGSIESFDELVFDLDDIQKALPYIEGKPIRRLGWAGTKIGSLEELSGITITSGGTLGLAWSNMSSLDGLERFEGISKLDLKGCHNLTDLTPTLQLQSLQELTLAPDMRERAEEQLQGRHFIIEYYND